jgi:hypothetical protein
MCIEQHDPDGVEMKMGRGAAESSSIRERNRGFPWQSPFQEEACSTAGSPGARPRAHNFEIPAGVDRDELGISCR